MKILELINQNLSYALALAIIHSLWQGALFLGIIHFIKRFMPNRSPGFHYSMHFLALFGLFVCFIFNIGLTIFNPSLPRASAFTNFEWMGTYLMSDSGFFFSVHEMIAWIWLGGVLFMLSRFLIGNTYLYQTYKKGRHVPPKYYRLLGALKKKLSIRQRVKLVHSDKLLVPMTMGLLSPIIVFPLNYFNQLTIEEFESILIHELVHIKRKDFLFNQIQMFIECLMFFNPVVWYLSSQMRRLREYRCDDEVQNHMPDQRTYLKALYQVAKLSNKNYPFSIALFHKKSELVMRVKRMLNQENEKYNLKPYYSFAIFMVMLFGLFAFQQSKTVTSENPVSQRVEAFVNTEIELPINNIYELLSSVEEEEDTQEIVQLEDIVMSEKIQRVVEKLQPLSKKVFPKLSKIDRSIGVSVDTVPESDKAKKLRKEIEIQSVELEELATKLEKEIHANIEFDSQQLEELSAKLEKRINERMKDFELNLENNEIFVEIENLTKELELKLETKMESLVEIDEEKLKEYELAMEKLAEEMTTLVDADGNVTDEEKMKGLKKKMQEEQKKLNQLVKGIKEQHKNIMDDSDIQALQQQISELSTQISAMNLKRDELMDPISKEIQQEMMELQAKIQKSMIPLQEELHKTLQERAREIEVLTQELMKELNRNQD